jgi:hypothetical protein
MALDALHSWLALGYLPTLLEVLPDSTIMVAIPLEEPSESGGGMRPAIDSGN